MIFHYDAKTLKLSIQTLEGTLIRAYSEDKTSAANNTKEYASDEIRFQNNKALLRGLIVVRDTNTGLYGIQRYENGKYLLKYLVQNITISNLLKV